MSGLPSREAAPEVRPSLFDLLAGAERSAGRLSLTLPQAWMQGRTAYGGLSVAIAYEAARTVADDLPPLRSVQVAFVGPLSGRLTATAEVLRRGRSAAFVRADVGAEAGLGLRATFMFAADRASHLDYEHMPAPRAPDVDAAAPVRRPPLAPVFVDQFEFRHALARDASRAPVMMRWARLAERAGLDATTQLLAIADALPPAAVSIMTAAGPVSSATWQINLLSRGLDTCEGWWLLRAEAEQARGGFSSQSMQVWNADRQPVAIGMQSVAIFA